MAILKRFKQALGIEGLKIQLIVDEAYDPKSEHIEAVIELETINKVTIQRIEIKLMEKYERGRKDNKLIDEMVIGQVVLKGPMKLNEKEVRKVEFKLPFDLVKSPMDALQDQNIFYKGLIKLAKFAKGVKSKYTIEAIAKVKGTVLDASDKIEIKFN